MIASKELTDFQFDKYAINHQLILLLSSISDVVYNNFFFCLCYRFYLFSKLCFFGAILVLKV